MAEKTEKELEREFLANRLKIDRLNRAYYGLTFDELIRLNMATSAAATQNTIQNTTRDLLDNNNANTRAILDALTAQRIEAKDEKIAAQNQQIFQLQLAASQQAQNAYLTANQEAQTAELIRRIAPAPVPSYAVPAPYPFCGSAYSACGCGC